MALTDTAPAKTGLSPAHELAAKSLLGGLPRVGLGSLELVQVLVRALDDVELVVHRLIRLDGVVQVLVRHGGCFFLGA